MSKFLQTCGYRYGFLCRFRYDNPKAVRHNSNFQDDGIEASPKKCIQVVNPNSVNCYEQNCLSYFFFYVIIVLMFPILPMRCIGLRIYFPCRENPFCSAKKAESLLYISPRQRLGFICPTLYL